MTTKKTGVAAPEQPAAGGSYVRQGDGTLKRVEHTAEPTADTETSPADTAGGDQAASEQGA